MTKLYLVRHGETDWNHAKRYQGSTDIPLNSEGMRQAALLGKRFEQIPLDAVYSSPLKRAYDTARAVAERKDLSIQTMKELSEINFGSWEGLTEGEIMEKYKEDFLQFRKEPYLAKIPGEGSFQIAADRIERGIQKIISENQDKSILVVSHGGLLRLGMLRELNLEGSFYRKVWLDNTSISLLEYKKERALMRTLNDRAHLGPLL